MTNLLPETKRYHASVQPPAKQELGLQTYGIEETVRATGDRYLALGLVREPTEEAPKL